MESDKINEIKRDYKFASLNNELLFDAIIKITNMCFDECTNKEKTKHNFEYNFDCTKSCIKNYSEGLMNK